MTPQSVIGNWLVDVCASLPAVIRGGSNDVRATAVQLARAISRHTGHEVTAEQVTLSVYREYARRQPDGAYLLRMKPNKYAQEARDHIVWAKVNARPFKEESLSPQNEKLTSAQPANRSSTDPMQAHEMPQPADRETPPATVSHPKPATPDLTPELLARWRHDWLKHAHYFASLGFAILPLAGKLPIGHLVPHGSRSASVNPADWERWLDAEPACNLGIAVPDGVLCVDVDPREKGDAKFEALEKQHGEAFSLNTLVLKSGSGGYHFFYRTPPGMRYPGKTLDGQIGVDIKEHANAGYLVAAPSIHPTEGQYQIACAPGHLAAPPSWVQRQLVPTGESRAKALAADEIDDVRRDAAGWGLDPDLVVQDVSADAITRAVEAVAPISQEGNRYAVLVKMGGLLNRLGWSVESVEAFARAYVDEYGGRDPEHGVRGCVNGMKYPSGYHALVDMLPAGPQREALAASLDGLANPYGVHLRESRAASAADVLSRLAKVEAAQQLARENPNDALAKLGRRLDVHAPVPNLEYVVDGLPWHTGAVNAVIGFANAGKSPFAASLVVAFGAGTAWQDRPVKQGRVLVIAFEASYSLLRHIQRHAAALGVGIDNIDFIAADPGAFISDPAYLDNLKAVTQNYAYTFVDTYNAGMIGVEINEAKFAAAAKRLEIDGHSVFVVLHTTKDQQEAPTLKSIAGTGALAGAIKAAVGLWRPADIDDGYSFEAVCVRTPDKTFAPWRFRMVDRGAGWVYEQIEVPEGDTGFTPKEKLKDRKARYAEQIDAHVNNAGGDTVTLADLVSALRVEKRDVPDVEAAAGSLVKLGVLEVDKKKAELTWKIKRSAYERSHLASGGMSNAAPRSNAIQFPPPHAVTSPQVNYLPPEIVATAGQAPTLPDSFGPKPGGGFTQEPQRQAVPSETTISPIDRAWTVLTEHAARRCGATGAHETQLTKAEVDQILGYPIDATALGRKLPDQWTSERCGKENVRFYTYTWRK